MKECPLCEAAVITTRYFESDVCWIADCAVCAVPMVVWRAHDPAPPSDVRAILHGHLARVADEVMGTERWRLDDRLRTIPDHYHAHARPRSWPFF